jgi:type I restriction enzyme S subunit
LTHPETKHYIEGFNAGGSRRAVTKRHIEAFSIPLPPLPIQQDIAHILGTLDDKIELNRRMNETLEAMARAIFKSWFVDFDPVRAKASGEPPESIRRRLGLTPEVLALFPDAFNDSELGEIPAGWGVDTLKGLTSKIGSGATPRGGREVYLDEGVSLIRSQNVYDANFVWEGLAHISDEAAKQLAGVEVNTGDVLINITGASILRTCVVDPDVLPARVNQHVAIIRGKPGIPPRYLHLHLLDPETKTYLMGLNAGASRPCSNGSETPSHRCMPRLSN